MSNNTATDDDMPAEIDFSQGERAKFHNAAARLNVPVYLDPELQQRLAQIADAKGIEMSKLVNEMLKKDFELIDLGR